MLHSWLKITDFTLIKSFWPQDQNTFGKKTWTLECKHLLNININVSTVNWQFSVGNCQLLMICELSVDSFQLTIVKWQLATDNRPSQTNSRNVSLWLGNQFLWYPKSWLRHEDAECDVLFSQTELRLTNVGKHVRMFSVLFSKFNLFSEIVVQNSPIVMNVFWNFSNF